MKTLLTFILVILSFTGYTQTRTIADVNDFFAEITKGNIPGHSIMRGTGARQDINAMNEAVDVWLGNTLSNTPAALASTKIIPIPDQSGEKMSIISESDADKTGSTGALTVRI